MTSAAPTPTLARRPASNELEEEVVVVVVSIEAQRALAVQRRYRSSLAAAGSLATVRDLDAAEIPSWTGPLPEDVGIATVDADGVPSLWLHVPGAVPGRVLLFVHGGGFLLGSPESVQTPAATVGRAARADVMLPRYRLAPEHPYPAAVDDLVTSYEWLLARGHDPGAIALVGESAGGGGVVAALVALRDAGVELPAAAVVVSGAVDFECSGESWSRNADADGFVSRAGSLRNAATFLAGADPHAASPLHADLVGLPPLLVLAGGAECSLDGSLELAARAARSGADVTLRVWAGMPHLWHDFAFLPEAREALDMIGRFAMTHTSPSTAYSAAESRLRAQS